MTAFASRIDAFLRSLPNGRHLIITHGGVIRLLLRRCGLDRSVPPGTSHDVVIRGSAPPCKGLQTPQRGLSNDAAAEGSFAECTTIPEGHKRSRETPKTGPPRRGGKKMER